MLHRVYYIFDSHTTGTMSIFFFFLISSKLGLYPDFLLLVETGPMSNSLTFMQTGHTSIIFSPLVQSVSMSTFSNLVHTGSMSNFFASLKKTGRLSIYLLFVKTQDSALNQLENVDMPSKTTNHIKCRSSQSNATLRQIILLKFFHIHL